ncbi:hypothetical protein CYMTET_52974 [Cymbomonas tetramitiformis]|uniref:Uncharacterized protein n=1 Tax=Cymbomonas tetramitiformis TaxID=36881 RepID=A0AAE0BJ95_9CHLO|nr:hypothetical protein CYMTET_52974 [Cymbomonas tetramitiformis]
MNAIWPSGDKVAFPTTQARLAQIRLVLRATAYALLRTRWEFRRVLPSSLKKFCDGLSVAHYAHLTFARYGTVGLGSRVFLQPVRVAWEYWCSSNFSLANNDSCEQTLLEEERSGASFESYAVASRLSSEQLQLFQLPAHVEGFNDEAEALQRCSATELRGYDKLVYL